MGNQEQARAEYDKAIRFAHNESDRLNYEMQKAMTYVRDGNYAEADKHFLDIATTAHNKEHDLQEAQALRHLARECWQVILSAQYLEPGGQASRTGARLNLLIRRHYVQLLRHYQARGRLHAWVDVDDLAGLIVGITTWNFSRFVAVPSITAESMLGEGHRQLTLILTGLVARADGSFLLKRSLIGPAADAERIGRDLGHSLRVDSPADLFP